MCCVLQVSDRNSPLKRMGGKKIEWKLKQNAPVRVSLKHGTRFVFLWCILEVVSIAINKIVLAVQYG